MYVLLTVSFFLAESGLEFLRRLPQFISMRRMVQQNPQSLPVLLQQLGQENPQLLQVRFVAMQCYFST